jgi:hypothetical protein
MRFGADGCKSLRHFLVPRADFAWDNRVQAISSAAKAGIPGRLGHARGYASALSPSIADPKCSSAVAATLPAPPAALSPVYTDVVRRESMAFTTLLGNFVGGNHAAAVSARERNDSRAISRDQAPATI